MKEKTLEPAQSPMYRALEEEEFTNGILEMYNDISTINFVDCYYDESIPCITLVYCNGMYAYADMEPDSKIWEADYDKICISWSTASERFAVWTRFFGYEESEYYPALLEEWIKDAVQFQLNVAFTPTEVLVKSCETIESIEEPSEYDNALYDCCYHELYQRGKELR